MPAIKMSSFNLSIGAPVEFFKGCVTFTLFWWLDSFRLGNSSGKCPCHYEGRQCGLWRVGGACNWKIRLQLCCGTRRSYLLLFDDLSLIWRVASRHALPYRKLKNRLKLIQPRNDTKIMIIATSCCYKSCRENISFDVRTYLLLIKVVFAFETFKNEQAALDEPCSQRKDDYI